MTEYNAAGFDHELALRNLGLARDKTDGALHVEFYEKEVHNAFKSAESEKVGGPPVFDKKVYCIIRPPGRLEEWNQPARDKDKQRFPREWQAFLTGNKELGGGTSIEELPNVAHDQRSQLRYIGVYAIEQLAEATDGQLHAIGIGARELRDRARKWVAEKEVKEDLSTKVRAKELESMVHEQGKLIEALRLRLEGEPASDYQDPAHEDEAPKKRGRPKKSESLAA